VAAGVGFLRPARPKAESQKKRDASKKFMSKENLRGTSALSVMSDLNKCWSDTGLLHRRFVLGRPVL
jgi:hypothetical protein